MVTCVAGDVRLIARSEGEVPCAMESHSALRQFKASISVNNVISLPWKTHHNTRGRVLWRVKSLTMRML